MTEDVVRIPVAEQVELEKYRVRIGFYKFLLGTFALGAFSSLLTYLVQQQELNQKALALDHQIKLEKQAADTKVRQLEQDYLSKFIDLALSGDIEVRVRFAHYFKSLTSSREHRTRWEAYYSDLVTLRKETGNQLSKDLAALRVELAKDEKNQDGASIERLRDRIQGGFDELRAAPDTRAVGPTTTGLSSPVMPRGIRNNNPFNLPIGTDWKGLAARTEMTPIQTAESKFAVFQDPIWGVRAGVLVLHRYKEQYGLKTLRDLAHRWAEPEIRDEYAEFLSSQTGVDADATFDLNRYENLLNLVRAMIRFENGAQPYDVGTLRRGLSLAGVDKIGIQ